MEVITTLSAVMITLVGTFLLGVGIGYGLHFIKTKKVYDKEIQELTRQAKELEKGFND